MAKNSAEMLLNLLRMGTALSLGGPDYSVLPGNADVRLSGTTPFTHLQDLAAQLNGMGYKGTSSATQNFLRDQYPDDFSPTGYHEYDVDVMSDGPNLNSAGKANMALVEDAGRMQSLEEHNAAMLAAYRPALERNLQMGMSRPQAERSAMNAAIEAEKKLPQFWNESTSRLPFAVSSSAVSGIRLTPDARIEVAWKTNPGKYYTFKAYPNTFEASLAAQALLKADSIGRAVMPYQRKGQELHFKNPGNNYSWWNRPNYDPAYA